MGNRDRDAEKNRSLQLEKGNTEARATAEEQDAELPLGPLREAIVDLHAPEEDETVQADRAEAERRGKDRS